jgi:gliding motility-associated-like protein
MKILLLISSFLITCISFSREVRVLSVADNGAGTLREAIVNAIAFDTIIIDVKGTIILSSQINFITNDLTIIGPYPKHNNFTSNSGTVFNITNRSNIKFIGLGFKDANVDKVIYINNSGNIIFESCLFENNTCSVSTIFSTISFIGITNCSFIQNNSFQGGAININDASGQCRITNCTFWANTSTSHGGAIYLNTAANLDLINNLFYENQSTGLGEAIQANANSVLIDFYNNVFKDNGTGAEVQVSSILGAAFNFPSGNVYYETDIGNDAPVTYSGGSNKINPADPIGIRPLIVEDGYGLKYFTITSTNSSLIDAGADAGNLPATDTRRAPRILTGTLTNVVDAGPVEYTLYRVLNSNSSGPNSLTEMIIQVNSSADAKNYIEFDIIAYSQSDNIDFNSPVAIDVPVYIDGYSQNSTGISGPDLNGLSGVTPAINLIQITNPGGALEPLILNTMGITVTGLHIYGFDEYGLLLSTSANNAKIYGNHIGFDGNAVGSYTVFENNLAGVRVNAINTKIGGNQHWQRNVISGNGQTGGSGFNSNILFGNTASGIEIYGNFLGPQPEGNSSFTFGGQVQHGIHMSAQNVQGNGFLIGNSHVGGRNIISGNKSSGIYLSQMGTGNIIDNNYIGLGYDGESILGNGTNGIYLVNNTNQVQVGQIFGNVISGQSSAGATGINIQNCQNTSVTKNLIGLNALGTLAKANEQGISVSGSSTGTLIGIDNTNSNVISGNSLNGIYLLGGVSTSVSGNIIGLDMAGGYAIGNGLNGVKCDFATGSIIGGNILNRNIISGNGTSNSDAGINLSETGSTTIAANYIGTNITGLISIGNQAGIVTFNSHAGHIGSAVPNNNIISGNVNNGITINSANTNIEGNVIGLNSNLSGALANGNNGIQVIADSVSIGVSEVNIISGNTTNGIFLVSVTNCDIDRCIIGTNPAFSLGLGNSENGIYIAGGSDHNIGVLSGNTIVGHIIHAGARLDGTSNVVMLNNMIGLTTTGIVIPNQIGVQLINGATNIAIGDDITTNKNVISGNLQSGIEADGNGTTANSIKGNYIGLSSDGNTMVPNNTGIIIFNGATNTSIGGNVNQNQRNVISGNTISGILIAGANTSGNVIYHNFIGINSSGTQAKSNNIGVSISSCTVANYVGDINHINNYPVISGNNAGIIIDNSSNQHVYNSRIGTISNGTVALSNVNGIVIQNSSTNTIVGGIGLKSNLISGNTNVGIEINSCSSNTIIGNQIGTDFNGTAPLANNVGIHILGGTSNIIGTGVAGEENLISSNTTIGIVLENNADSTIIKSNFIGTGPGGNSVFAGSGNNLGVIIKNTTSFNTIGGLVGEGNIFANNNISILIDNSSNQIIEGNKIGFNTAGSSYIGNTLLNVGIYLNDASLNTIGNVNAGYENAIANQDIGVFIDNSDQTTVVNNYIGNDLLGNSVLSGGVGAQNIGIRIDSTATNNVIGPGNVISGNNLGISILRSGTSNNRVKNNFIGVNSSGNALLPNYIGIKIGNGASNNIIGGLYSIDKNVISGNAITAIKIINPGTSNNIVSGNLVGLGDDEITLIGNSEGIRIFDNASYNIIGGANLDSVNYICNNGTSGINIGNGASSNFIIGNIIGEKPDLNACGNGSGVILDNANLNIIGGINNLDQNKIMHNLGAGVEIKTGGSDNQILGNVIHSNLGLAIDINDDGPTVNNSTGIQSNIEMPIILEAFDCDVDGNMDIGLALRGLVQGQDYIVEFYDNTFNPDGTGYGGAISFLYRDTHTAVNTIDTVFFDIGFVAVGAVISASVTGLNGNGGTSEMSFNNTVLNHPPQPTITSTSETCQGSNDGIVYVNDLANSRAYYFSIDADVPLYNPTFDSTFILPPGSYTVNSQYLNGCVVISAPQVINLGPVPTFTTLSINDTCGLLGQINLNSSGNAVGVISDYILVGTPDIISASGQFTSLNVGSYQVYITTILTGENCTSDTTDVSITSYDMLNELNFSFTDFCSSNNGVVTSLPSFSQGTYSFNPDPADGSSINSSTGEITGGVQGTQYIVDYSYGTCVYQQSPNAIDTINPSFSYDNYCISSQAVNSPVNPGGTYSFNPDPADGATIDLNTGEIISPYGGTTYFVEYNTGGGCPGVLIQGVTVFSLPIKPNISTNDSVYCNSNDPIEELIASGINIDWFDDETLTNSLSNSLEFIPEVITVGNNYFFAQETDLNGCKSQSDSINIFMSDISLMSAGENQVVCLGSNVSLNANGGEVYWWLNIEENNELYNPFVNPLLETNYIVLITDEYGCEVTDSVFVSFLSPSECNIIIYTAFSPNNDGVNDVWIIEGIEGYKENIVYFYNRWGDLVNSIDNYDNATHSWGGMNKFTNSMVVAGTYFYVVEAGGINAKSGWVQIVR